MLVLLQPSLSPACASCLCHNAFSSLMRPPTHALTIAALVNKMTY